MREYQPFAISNFRTGFDEAVEPWLLPRDAYQSMINAHLYRGIIEKISGYNLFALMGYRTEMSLGTPDGVTKTFTITIPTLPTTSNFFAYGTITNGSAETFSYASDASSTVINLMGTAGGIGTVNIATGVVSITFNTAPPTNSPTTTYSSIFFQWDSASPGNLAIMGIKQYYANNGTQSVMVFDQHRVGIITSNSGVLASDVGALNGITEIPHDYYQSAVFTGDGATTVFTGTLTAKNFAPFSVQFLQFAATTAVPVSTITDNGSGALQGTNVNSSASFINYVTGDYKITFTTAPATGNIFNATVGIFGNIFTGGKGNFFTLTNYQYKAFFTNNVDPIMYYDGTSLHYLNTITTLNTFVIASGGVPTNLSITKCLHVFTLRERLLLLSPTYAFGGLQGFTIQWSVIFNPLVFTNDAFLPASTSEPIRAFGYINTDLIVRFANSERVFRYTGDAFDPFRWDSTNNIWACDGPYSTINYDSWFSTLGRPAIVGSDGVNVRRADEIIPDFTDPSRIPDDLPVPFLNQTSIQQCYGERFDDVKEGWLCYNSDPLDQSGPVPSDNILSFNYLDETYAIYSFPLSCLGFGSIVNVPTWGTTFTPWDMMNVTWDSYQIQRGALIDLGGDQFDTVYQLNEGTTQTNVAGATIPVLMSVISKNFNPFIEQGQLARLGYIDLLVTANNDTTLLIQFYINDQLYIDSNGNPAGFYQQTILTFAEEDAMSPTTNQTKVWKRIYVGSVAKSHTVRFYQDYGITDVLDQPVFIHSMVLYMKPAGRIFN